MKAIPKMANFMNEGGNAGALVQMLQHQSQSPLLWQINLSTGTRGPDNFCAAKITRREFFQEYCLADSEPTVETIEIGVFQSCPFLLEYTEMLVGPMASRRDEARSIRKYPVYVWGSDTNDPTYFVVHPEGYVQYEQTIFYDAEAFARFFGPIPTV